MPAAADVCEAGAVCARAFAALMDRLGPFGPGRRVVAAVSGGADSMALAWLLREWGAPCAVIVDHGLRPGSGIEADEAAHRLSGLGIAARVMRVSLAPGPDLGARARAARYAALLEACRAEGLPDLVLGHHARDQVETVHLRAGRGSGPAGLAGMPAIGYRGPARLLRPLLGIGPGRLRATLRAAGVAWAEDPTNTDPATARGALRRSPLAPVPDGGPARAEADAAVAAELARAVELWPGGYARVDGALSAAGWSALVWTVSGRAYPPGRDAAARLARAGAGTLHGVRIAGGWVAREAEAAPVPARPGAVWDGRFRVEAAPPGMMIGPAGDTAARLRTRPGPPAFVLRTLPALRLDGKLSTVPHLAYPDAETCRSVTVEFRPARPLAGAAFTP